MTHHEDRFPKGRSCLNIALCDDSMEYLVSFRSVLLDCCARRDWDAHISLFQHAETLLNADLTGCHVLFLDIALPDIDGITLSMRLREKYPELILVFLTACLQYAPAGYKVRAFRYLLKENLGADGVLECLDDVWREIYAGSESIEVTDAEHNRLCFRLRDILYCSGTPQRHTVFHIVKTDGVACVECVGKLSDYEEQLRGHGFLRIQKSYLVNMFHIDRMANYTAFLKNGETLRISVRDYQNICGQYLQWRG